MIRSDRASTVAGHPIPQVTASNEGVVPPLVVMGMHRSGTTLVARMLQAAGIFMGRRKEKNSEAVFFVRLNDWLLRQAGGAWDHPEALDRILDQPELRSLLVSYLTEAVVSWPARQYTGWARWLLGGGLLRMKRPWGWKDPRNTFTLPLWLELFPQARIVHVYRNGVDVAASLRARAERTLVRARSRYERLRRLGVYRVRLKHRGFIGSAACLDLGRAFALWEVYVKRAMQYDPLIGDGILHCRYEDIVLEPGRHIAAILSHCRIEPNRQRIDATARLVRPERCFAYQRDVQLREFFNSVRDSVWLRRLGYER